MSESTKEMKYGNCTSQEHVMKKRNQIIYEMVLNGHKINSIASEFKISTANVYQIIKRKNEEAKFTEFRKMMSIRTQNVLLKLFEHDETIFDDPERVCNLSRGQLIATKNIGRTTIDEIMNACKLIRAQKKSGAQTVKFTNVCPVFLVQNILKTTEYYVNVLGFKYAKHFDKKDRFATIYRDSIEIVLVEKLKGEIESNKSKYGNGYDAYISTDSIEGIDIIYQEYRDINVKIISAPQLSDYGSYEFAFQDIDGRNIGIGLIADKNRYFEHSNFLNQL